MQFLHRTLAGGSRRAGHSFCRSEAQHEVGELLVSPIGLHTQDLKLCLKLRDFLGNVDPRRVGHAPQFGNLFFQLRDGALEIQEMLHGGAALHRAPALRESEEFRHVSDRRRRSQACDVGLRLRGARVAGQHRFQRRRD